MITACNTSSTTRSGLAQVVQERSTRSRRPGHSRCKRAFVFTCLPAFGRCAKGALRLRKRAVTQRLVLYDSPDIIHKPAGGRRLVQHDDHDTYVQHPYVHLHTKLAIRNVYRTPPLTVTVCLKKEPFPPSACSGSRADAR